jgi:hypothetical protein
VGGDVGVELLRWRGGEGEEEGQRGGKERFHALAILERFVDAEQVGLYGQNTEILRCAQDGGPYRKGRQKGGGRQKVW